MKRYAAEFIGTFAGGAGSDLDFNAATRCATNE